MSNDGNVSLVDVVNVASDVLRDVELGVLKAADVQGRACLLYTSRCV